MCRITTENHHLRRLRINSFHLRLTLSSSVPHDLLPDALSLVLFPHFNATSLSVNGSKVPSNSPAFLSLHRVLSPDDAVFASKDRLRASDGLSFEIHAADHRLLKGVVYRDGDCDDAWRIDCNFNCASFDGGGINDNVREAEISVALEDGRLMRERVTMAATAAKRMRRRRRRCRLEDIPEGREEEQCCCCCDDVSSSESDGESEFEIDCVVDSQEDAKMEMEMEMKMGGGVRWAADVGFWVVCFSVGFLVSRASARRLRPKKLL